MKKTKEKNHISTFGIYQLLFVFVIVGIVIYGSMNNNNLFLGEILICSAIICTTMTIKLSQEKEFN